MKPGQIVVGVDDSPQSCAAVKWAARDAELHKSELTLVHVIAPETYSRSMWAGVPVYPDDARWRREKMAAYQSLGHAQGTAIAAVGKPDELRVNKEVLVGPVAKTLATCAQHADMLAVGCRDHNIVHRTLFGSTSADLIHRAHGAVAFVHNGDAPTTRSPKAPVLVGVDGSPASDAALDVAFDEASRRGVDLLAFHASTKEDAAQVLGERLGGWSERYPEVGVHKIVAADNPVAGLRRLAEKAQLLILGSHDDRFTDRLHRSIRSAVLAAIRIPVIIAGHAARPA